MESFARLEAQFAHLAIHGLTTVEKRRGVTRHLEKVFQRMAARLKPHSVIEIGAHEGHFSLAMRRLLPEARIVAFEANPAVFAQHREQLAGAGVDYRNLAIADASATMPFGIPVLRGEKKTTHAGLMQLRDAEDVERIEVPAIPLDQARLPGPFVLWIDVEGALRQVLEGASATLGDTLAIYAELDTAPQFTGGMQAHEAIRFLEAAGFVALARDAQKPIQFNAIFVKRSVAGDNIAMRALNDFYAGLGRLAGITAAPGEQAA